MTEAEKPLIEDLPHQLQSTIVGLMSIGIIGGLMTKMFGLDTDKEADEIVEKMMAGAVRGMLEYFEFRLEQKQETIERLQKEISMTESKDGVKLNDTSALEAALKEAKRQESCFKKGEQPGNKQRK